MRRATVLSVLALLALTGCSTEARGSAGPSPGVVAQPAEYEGEDAGGT